MSSGLSPCDTKQVTWVDSPAYIGDSKEKGTILGGTEINIQEIMSSRIEGILEINKNTIIYRWCSFRICIPHKCLINTDTIIYSIELDLSALILTFSVISTDKDHGEVNV